MLPALPDVPPDQRACGTYPLRFEDLTQDGRLMFAPIVASVGAAIWRPMLSRHALSAVLQANGIRPIFTRLAIDATSTRLDLADSLTAHGTYELAHDRKPDGGIRLFLNMWTDIVATSTNAPIARLFAEHVLTRPFAPAEERRVAELPGMELPTAHYRPRPFDELSNEPSGAAWLESAMHLDSAAVVFSIAHTDVNQHINSLVYPRLFEEAALRRFAAVGKTSPVLGRSLEIGFRKPFFAGQRARLALRAFETANGLGAAGGFFDAAETATDSIETKRPHAYVRMGFTP